MNKILITGRLAADPEVRYTQSGKAVASFTLAVAEGYGENKNTSWIPIVAWEKLAETCGNNLTKGQRILIEGRLQIRSYEANDGQKRRVAEVIAQNMEFLENKKDGDGGRPNNDGHNPFGGQVIPEEEIPF